MPLIHTERLDLVPGTEVALRAELVGRDALQTALGVTVPAAWPPELFDASAVNDTLRWMSEHPSEHDWGFFYLVLREGDRARTLVGTGGFRGAPDLHGRVELGYALLPEFQHCGYATETVNAWLVVAFRDPRVQAVTAQTLASLTPSIRVLERTGFTFAGVGTDTDIPEGEQVVRYERRR